MTSHMEVTLVFFSTFEPINLTPDSVLQREHVPMLYDSASTDSLPSLYICHVRNVLGRVPLMPCFVGGNSNPTIPHSFRSRNLSGGVADTRHDKGNGSRLYEVNIWMWRYGRGQERTQSVVEAMQERADRVKRARQVAGATLKRRRMEKEGSE